MPGCSDRTKIKLRAAGFRLVVEVRDHTRCRSLSWRLASGSDTRSSPRRLVNLVQRHGRPIVRGKARAAVEFGAKISVSVQNGFPFLHRISWNAYNEGDDLIAQAEKYKQDNGSYPERICADRIYINTKNRHYCTSHGIRLSCKRWGRPPKDAEIHAAQKQQLSADHRRRNEVEGVFGSGKRKYSLFRSLCL